MIQAQAPEAPSGTIQAQAPEAPSGTIQAQAPEATSETIRAQAPESSSETIQAQAPDASSDTTQVQAPEASSETTQVQAAEASSDAEAEILDITQKLDACYTMALDAINAEDYDTARQYLNICFAYCDPKTNQVLYADLLLKQACINVIEGDGATALLQLDAALTVDPELADAYLVATQIYNDAADYPDAAACLEKYIEMSGETSLYETLGQLYEAGGNSEAAQKAYDKFTAAGGKISEEAGFETGLYRMESGRFEEAIEAFKPYVENETYAAGALFNIGVCQMNLGDYKNAVESFTESEKKGGMYSGLYYNRGICYLMSEEWANGARDFISSIQTEPFVDDAKYNLAICRMQTGEYDVAIEMFTDLIGDGKQANAQASVSLSTDGTATDTEGQEKKPVNDAAYYFRGICNAAVGNLEDAIRDYTTCIEHGYEVSQSYYQRAQVYAAMGDSEKQNSDLEKSLNVK
jgi:tetratricopeptide (TPR) repeat protein